MSRHSLDPAFAKIKRAETHIKDLDSAIKAFLQSNPYRLVSKVNTKQTEEVWSIQIDCVPPEIDSIAADAIHNLRTPLDKMLAAVTIQKNGSTDGIKFPIGRSSDRFKSALASQKERIPTSTIHFLKNAEAYPQGNGALIYALHDIDIGDKHHSIVTPISLGFTQRQFGDIRATGGQILRLGSRRGRHMIPVAGATQGAWHMHQPVEKSKPILRANPLTGGTYLEFTAPHNDMEILTTTAFTKVDADIKPALNIAFSEIEGLEEEPVVAVLQKMRDVVEGTLVEFRDRFF